MSELSGQAGELSGPDRALLENIAAGMSITADVSRSDLLLVRPHQDGRARVIAQARPHSIASIYEAPLLGQVLSRADAPAIADALRRQRPVRAQRDLMQSGAPIHQEVYPIPDQAGQLLALLSIETSLIQLERHRQRHTSFRRAIEWVKRMCMAGELVPAATLSPFGEWDGILLVDAQRRISYVSGIANNLYRRLGYMEDLRGRRLSALSTDDDELALSALTRRQPLEREAQEGSHIWIRKVLPVWPPRTVWGWLQGLGFGQGHAGVVSGALIMVHDATEERRKKQELKVKATMIQEVHHRVKNNLQTIAAMLRMQVRRTKDAEALHALNEAITRILSVAVIHEFLSLDENQTINLRDVCQRIVTQNRQVNVAPDQRIALTVDGPAIHLPSQQATACALVVNELIHNTLEHGFETKKQGQIRVTLVDGGDKVGLEVWDDGTRLPEAFDLAASPSLGLQIVRTLVQDDLRGKLRLENQATGVAAILEIPKASVEQR